MGASSLGIPVGGLSWLRWCKKGLPTAGDTHSLGIRSCALWNRGNILNTSKHAPWLRMKYGQFQLLWLPHHDRCNLALKAKIKPATGKGTMAALSGRWINMRQDMRKMTLRKHVFHGVWREQIVEENLALVEWICGIIFGFGFAQTLGLRTWTTL